MALVLLRISLRKPHAFLPSDEKSITTISDRRGLTTVPARMENTNTILLYFDTAIQYQYQYNTRNFKIINTNYLS
jgi:hypothetical protein